MEFRCLSLQITNNCPFWNAVRKPLQFYLKLSYECALIPHTQLPNTLNFLFLWVIFLLFSPPYSSFSVFIFLLSTSLLFSAMLWKFIMKMELCGNAPITIDIFIYFSSWTSYCQSYMWKINCNQKLSVVHPRLDGDLISAIYLRCIKQLHRWKCTGDE